MTGMAFFSSLQDLFRKESPQVASFQADIDLMAKRIALHSSAPAQGSPILFPIIPWRMTAVPFFSLECALFFHSRGIPVKLLAHFSGLPFHQHPAAAEETHILKRLLKRIKTRLAVESLDPNQKKNLLSSEMARLLVRENQVWLAKSETSAYAGEISPAVENLLQKEYSAVESTLKRLAPRLVFVPGGVMGASPLYVEACRRLHIPFATYDSGAREIKLCVGGVAAHNGDTPQAFDYFLNCPESEQAVFEKHAFSWIEKRREGKDDFELQPQTACPDNLRDFILICLNYRADSAALMRQRLFPTVKEWLKETIQWAVRNQVRMVIRQHPCEKLDRFKGKDDWGGIVRSVEPEGEFTHYVAAADTINTYDLIERAACVLPFTSRVGVESAMLGKPVITTSQAFYSGLGFTYDPENIPEYFSLLEKASKGNLPLKASQIKRASIAYFAISEHTRIRTDFTPLPQDFATWSRLNPQELWKKPELIELTESLLHQKQFAIVRHESWRKKQPV